MKYPKMITKEIIPEEVNKMDLSYLEKYPIEDLCLYYSPKWSKKRRGLIHRDTLIGVFGRKEYRRELTIKEQFLIRIML